MLPNLLREISRSDPESVVNQAEIIDFAWLRRADARLLSIDGHATDAVRLAVTPIMAEVALFRGVIREVKDSDGRMLGGCTEAAGIYDRLLELTQRLIASLTSLYLIVIQNLS